MKLSRTGLLPRPEHTRDARLCIVATEGTHTEKQYLEGLFGSPKLKVQVLGAGSESLSAPEHVLARLSLFNDEYDLDNEDERWLMLDVDRWPVHTLHEVCQEAQQRGFRLAISNPCFELWLWLHLADADHADTNGKQFKNHLRRALGSYNPSRLDLSYYTPERIGAAIERAKALSQDNDQRWPDCPGTHVYKLVESLLPHLRPLLPPPYKPRPGKQTQNME